MVCICTCSLAFSVVILFLRLSFLGFSSIRQGMFSISNSTRSRFSSLHNFSVLIFSFPISIRVTRFSSFASYSDAFFICEDSWSIYQMVGSLPSSSRVQLLNHSTRFLISWSQWRCSSRQCWNCSSQYCIICNFFLASISAMQSKCVSIPSIIRSTFFQRYSCRSLDCFNFTSSSSSLGASSSRKNSSLSDGRTSASVRMACCWQQVSAHRRQMLLRQLRQTWEGSLKCSGHWRAVCRTEAFSPLPEVSRQVVDSRCGWLLDFYGERYDLRASFHISEYYKLPLGCSLPIPIIIIHARYSKRTFSQRGCLVVDPLKCPTLAVKDIRLQEMQQMTISIRTKQYLLISSFLTLIFYYFQLLCIVYLNMINAPAPAALSPLMRRSKLDRRTLKRVISDLVRRREEHEERINKLLDPNYQHQDATKSSPRGGYQEFSEVLRKLEAEEPQALQESMGGLGNHVNLLATVSLKTDYFLMEKQYPREEGELYLSLQAVFGKRQILYEFGSQQPEGVAQWLKTLVRFLVESELTNGLFVLEGERGKYDFYGTRFEHGKYEEILLSKQELEEAEKKLVILSKRQTGETINISWLLLVRLLKPLENLNFPLAVHRLFSFPYKKFNIADSLQLITFTDLLIQMHEQQSLKLYGIQQNKESSEIALPPLDSKIFKNCIPLIHRFKSVLLMNQTEFPAKNLPLSCLRNHFVVVTLILKGEGHYYISVGGESARMRFRLCLLDFEGNLVQYQIINSGEFMLSSSLREEEYELFICPEGESEEMGVLGEEESYQLVRECQTQFWLWVQGTSVCTRQGDLELQIRLKEQYNAYTLKIAREYMKQHDGSGLTEIAVESNSIVVRRLIIRVLGLVVDQFVSSSQRKFTVKYAQADLCDQFFQDTIISVASNEYVVLRQQTHIDSIQLVNTNTQISYKVFTSFI